MISEQRLQELIEQGATVYSKHRSYLLKNEEKNKLDFWYRRIAEIKDNKLHYIYEDSDYYEDSDILIKLEDLFETKEEAEWALEFGNITRTETLNLPSFNELQTKKEYYKNFALYKNKYYRMCFNYHDLGFGTIQIKERKFYSRIFD